MKKIILFLSVLFLLHTGRAQSGYYKPFVTSGVNVTIYSADSAQFFCVDNECYVTGKFAVLNTDSIGQVMVHVSPPVPLLYNVKHTSGGNCFVFPQSGANAVGYCLQSYVNGGSIQLYYNAPSSGLQYVYYFFTFTKKL